MEKISVIGDKVSVASKVTFIPGIEVKRNRTIVTVTDKNEANIVLNFWGKYAEIAARCIYPGKRVSFEGKLCSYAVDMKGATIVEEKGMIYKNGVIVSKLIL